MNAPARMPLGVYIHVPFCRVHCPYCDFYTYPADRNRQDEFVAALLTEIRLSHTRLNPDVFRVETIYLGGGTPALLPSGAIERIIDRIGATLVCANDMEITVEANPAELNDAYLSGIAAAGVNRLSVGVQSFDDALLKFLGRDHDSAAAHNALRRVSRWRNWSADLMFGSSAHDPHVLDNDLHQLLAYRPPHVSLYQLTVEAQTRFRSLTRRGRTFVVDSDTQADQFEQVCAFLDRSGYEHYEISNFAQPGFRARHNAAYWSRTDYLGLGPSASSLLSGRRTQNVKSLPKYLERLRHKHSAVASLEVLSPQEVRNERIWLGLRTDQGIDRGLLSRKAISWLADGIRQGLLANRGAGNIGLTRRGMALADGIASRLLLTDSM